MKWLHRLFKAVSPEERKGISLKNSKWEVSPIRDMPAFLRSLIGMIPENSILYLEGGSPDKEISSYIEERKTSTPSKVALGTIWPRPICYHMPFIPENVNGLAGIMERHATPEATVHLHIYKDNKILLQWHDAFYDDPLYISEAIDEEKIKLFCEKLSLKYKLLTTSSSRLHRRLTASVKAADVDVRCK